jgi:hypothetical protein
MNAIIRDRGRERKRLRRTAFNFRNVGFTNPGAGPILGRPFSFAMLKRLLVVCCCWMAGSIFAQEPVFINEFMANNATTLRDKDLEYSDWVEFRNTSAVAVNLNGYYLTDNTANLKKWKFPSVSVPANGYLVVFASGKDLSGAEVHTSF